MLLDPTVRRWMADNGHQLRIVDRRQTASDLADWIEKATAPTAAALPRLYIVDGAGKVCFESGCPIGPIQFLDLVKKWGAEK